ncbi:MAG: hypothetical protein H6R24_2635, partial [Proteobacteria bacterium]|nr:hypothetical protein [Pseudomonadota bacterium]
RFAALGGMPALTRPAAIQIALQIRLRQFQTGRTTIHDRAQRRTVALAEGGDSKQLAKRIAGHTENSLVQAARFVVG